MARLRKADKKTDQNRKTHQTPTSAAQRPIPIANALPPLRHEPALLPHPGRDIVRKGKTR
jgi:hypothetical protein